MKRLVLPVIALSCGVAAFSFHSIRASDVTPELKTATASRGDIVVTVGATGTLEAVRTVQVGSQVSGTITALSADYNSIVRAGDVIARLDASLFETQVEQARAGLMRAEADVERFVVSVDEARSTLTRTEYLADHDVVSASEVEAATASVRVVEAQLMAAQAQAMQAEASLHQAEVNLGHTVITAPIDGIVISRSVDVGQTVAATMSAPELFVLAADLREMRVLASLDESDVGRVEIGQRVTFRVDAYPMREFAGTVSQVRLEPVVVQNVVTYTTVIDVPNTDLRLKPGMTTSVTIEVARRTDVVRIPNAALGLRPPEEALAALGGTGRGTGATDPAGRGGRPDEAVGAPDAVRARVWVYDGERLSSVVVTLGLTDGSVTELVSGEVESGTQLVTGFIGADALANDNRPASSPLMPQGRGRSPR